MSSARGLAIAAAVFFFMISGWQLQKVIQDPGRDMLWTNIGLALLWASFGHTCVSYVKPRD